MSKSAKLESALRVVGTVALFVGLALMIVGCMVGPNYRRPVVNMPQAYRAAMAPEVSNNSSSGASIGDQSWQSSHDLRSSGKRSRKVLACALASGRLAIFQAPC